jgi:hypothetical protein
VLDWTNRAGASTLRVRTLTYLMATARRQGRPDRVQTLIDETMASYEPSMAQPSTRPSVHYPGALLANRAWLAWRDGRHDEAERLAHSALESWQSERVTYAFKWLATFPLIAIATTRSDGAALAQYTETLLREEQQRLESPVEAELRLSRTDPSQAASSAAKIVDLALSYGYL